MAHQPEPDPERHLKRIEKVFGVSELIQTLAIRQYKSPTKIAKDVELKDVLAKSKDLRTKRLAALGTTERYVLEMVAEQFCCDTESIVDGMVDSDGHIELLKSFVEQDGRLAVMFFYDLFAHPAGGMLKVF